MKYGWLLFDVDGTLFDYAMAESYALRTTWQQAGLAFSEEYLAIYRRINARIWLEFEKGLISAASLRADRFELLFDAIGVEVDARDFSAAYLKHLGEAADLIEGAEETIRCLRGKAGLMLVTNGLRDVQRSRLAKSTIGVYFADVVISEEVGSAKPDGGIFDAAFERMGLPRKEDVLIIGDSLSADIRGGNDYGIDTCWFNPARRPLDSEARVDYEITRLQDLLTILE